MAAEVASLPALHPTGYPDAFVAGRVAWLALFIAGEPVAKGRVRARVVAPKGRPPFASFYTPQETRDWEDYVAKEALVQVRAIDLPEGQELYLPLSSRLAVELRFNMQRPVSTPKRVEYQTKKPDLDNLAKSALDGLVKGRIITDDNCITDLSLCKRFADDRHPVGVEVNITAWLDAKV